MFTNSDASFSWTTDSLMGLDWLDFDGGPAPATLGLTYNTVITRLVSGADYEGWRYASRQEVKTFIFNITGISFSGDGDAIQYDGITDRVARFTGYTQNTLSVEAVWGLTSDTGGVDPDHHASVVLLDFSDGVAPGLEGTDRYEMTSQFVRDDFATPTLGHWLVRQTSPVPLPAAAWLLGSALGALGLMRRRTG